MANGNWWDKYKTGGAAVAPEEEKVEPVAQEGNWWDKYKSTPAPEPVEAKPTEATPQANWWDKYKVTVQPEQDPNRDLMANWDKTTKEFKEARKTYDALGARYQELGAIEARTPEQEQELQTTWNSLLASGFTTESARKKVADLQPRVDQYFANQEKARYQATEELRLNPALSGVVDQLHDLDAQQKEQLRLVRDSEDTDEIKQKKAEEITATIQKSKKDLIDTELSKSQGVENTLNSVAEALREKEAALEKRKTDIVAGVGATIVTAGAALPMAQEAIGREEAIQAESQKKIDTILANFPAEERERYVKEAEQINGLVTGDSQAAVINNELRISPTILFDDEAIKEAINSSEATDLQKKALRQNIPQLQKNLAKQEIPIFNELSEFRDFVEERNLQNASDVEKIKAYKEFDGNWFGKFGAQAKLGIQRGYANLIGQTQTLFGTAADLIARGTGSEKAREISDAFIGASMDQGDEVEKLTRMSQAVGGPQIVSEIAQVGTEMVPILASGGLVGIGAKTLAATGLRAVTPAVASNLGFATSVGTAGLQSYAGVYSDATRTLRDRFIQEGMGEDEAMDIAMRQAYLPAVLAGITTAAVTAAGGKTGVEAVFNLGKDAAFKGAVRTFFKDVASNTGMEALEETVDEFVQGMVAQATYNPDMSFGQIVEGAAKAGALGGFFGGSVGAATYGIETAQARKAIATRRPITDFNMSRINALEGDLKNLQTDSPLGSIETGPFDMFNPSERASGVGARPMEKTKIDELTTRRAQLTKMLADEKLSSITQNDVESELAQADYEYVKLLAQGRNNLLTEQTLDKIGQLPAESADAIKGLLKIANNMGAETLTGRERVALGITKVGNRFVAATETPLIKAEADGTFSVTDAGKQAVEAQNLIPLSRMIGISEGMKIQLEEEARIEEALRQEEAKREARRTAESDEAKRYGPQAAEALKQQVGSIPETPEAEQAKVRLAELLRREEEIKRQAVEALQKKESIPDGEVPPTGVVPVVPPVEPPVAPPTPPVEPETRPIIAPESLNPRGKQANKVLTSVGVDPETAAFVAQQYQDEAGEMGAEEWREFVLAKFQENGGVIPAATRYSEDAEYYQLAFNVGPEEAAQMVENAKYQNQQMAQAELERNKQWRRKDEARVTEAERGVVAPPPTGEGVAVGAGEVPPRPAIEGRRVPITVPAPQAVVTPPPTAALPEGAMAGAITEGQANRIIEEAKKERERKPPRDVPYRGRQATPLAPKDIIGKTAREALLETSRLNLSKIANRSPNEIMMQDVAAILAELNAPILDSEKVVSLSSIKRRGRARRVRLSDGRTVIAMPSSIRSTMETLVHEIGHTITADMVEKYAPRKMTGRGQNYLNALNKAIADPATPEPVQRLFSLYISTIEQLGITEQFFGANGVAGTPDPDTSVALAQRKQNQGTLRVDLNSDQLYGLANVAEFVSQTFSEPAFRDLLKTLQDPTNPRKTLWQAFVEAIQRILQLPKGSMAAAVIEASVDIGMITPPSGVRARGAAPTPSPRRPKITDLDVQHGNAITSGDEETAQRLTDEVAESRGYQSNNLLFHGTTHIFNVFRKDRTNVENDFGKGYYLTNTEADAQINYAGEGPDLTNRIERLSEQLQDNEDLDEAAARKKATEILSGGGQRIMRVYVRLNNPFNVGGPNETFLDYELPYDEATEEYGEPTGKLSKFLDVLRPIIESYAEDSAVDADKAIGNIVEYAMDRGGISASDLVRLLKQEDSGIMWASDENGDSATSEIIRQAIEDAGFDGIVDSLVNEKFGKAKKIGKAMAGMGPDTVHTIVFNSNQIKSADSATYDDQGNLIPLSQRFLAEEEDIRFAPEEEFNIIPEQVEDQIEGTPEAATINIMGEAFRLADEQNAAMGTTQGTLSLETITNAWINSGRDVNTLRNAIIRYTNLEPEAAATLADAIAQQVEIQRGIAEISDMASRRKAEKEAEPEERPYSFAQRIKEELPPALRSKINKAYEVLRNEVSVQEANQAMYGMDVKEAMEATMNMQNGVSMGVRSMMAQITLRKIIEGRKNARTKQDKADYNALVEAHVDFVDWINEYLVEMGQGIQAFARFSDLEADGMLLKLRKDTDKAITKHIRNRKSKIDQIKSDVEKADSSAFDASVKSNKNAIDGTAEEAAKKEAKQLTIEEQAQKLAQAAAKKVAGEVVRRRQPDPLSDLVNGHLRRYNANFIAEATAMGISPETAQKIEESAQRLRDMRVATKTERERFKAMQDERMRVKRQLARENKYIYGDRPTIWEDYQQMFSERLARRLMRDPKKKVPPSLLLFTDRLTENLLGFVPQAERQATTERSFQAMIEDALNNKEKYQEAFNKAMRDISAKVEELEAKASETEEGNEAYFQALAAQDFMDRLAPIIQDFPVSDKLVMRFVNQKMKAAGESLVAKYNEWYRSSKKTRLDIEQQLANALVADVKISDIDALKLSRAIIKDFRVKAEERREKALARFKKPKEKTKRLIESPLKKFFELINIGAMTDRDAYEVMAHRFDLPTWDQKFADQIDEMAKLIQDMPDGIERRRMTRNLMAEIAKKKGFNLADLGAGFAYSNILSSPDTFNVNLADTLINNFSNAFADAVSEKDFTRLRGVIAGYKKGWREAVQTFKTGLRINMPRLEEKTPLTVELVNYGKKGGVPMESTEGMNAIAKTILESPPAKVLNLWKYVTRIMEATDALNYTASVEGQRYAEAARIAREEGLHGKEKQKRINQILNLGNDVYQAALTQAEQEGYTGVDAKFRALEIQDSKIDPELKERSFERGLRDVYRNMPKGLAGYFAARFDRIVSGIENPWVRNALKLGISPFVITPTNLFNKWLDWSPYGYKRLFFGSGMFLSKEGPYYMEPSKVGSAEFYAQAFKASSSVFVMGLAMGLVKAGLLELVGRGPSDEEERKQWLADGNKPYTFSFMGGPQISFQYSPWALFLSVAANISNWEKYNKKEDATMLDRSVAAFIASTGVIMDLPFFAGPAEFLKAIESGSNKNYTSAVSKFVEGKMGMVFPNFLRYVDRLFDPTVYDHQGIKAIILDQTPFARRLGVQRVNLFGEPIGQDKPVIDRLVGRFVAFPKPSRESRILAKYDIYPYMPSPKEAKALVDGEEAQMTEEQYNKFVQVVGRETKQRINDLFDPDADITEQERERGKKRISQIFERARARAVREVSTY